jgi:DNA invertase Pin-like site-specific DNA recombinase
MKVIGYIRVSTEEQATSGLSLDAQRDKLTAYAKLYDLELIAIVDDAGQSAKSLHRPGLQMALDRIRRGEAAGLLIAKLDRLTRSVADWQTLIDEFFGEKPGKQLFSVADSIDTRTAAGRLVLNVLLSVAQWERETIAERTRDALQHKIKTGQRCGRIRFGCDLAADGRTLVDNPEQQAVVQLVAELRRCGKSLRAIAQELTARRIPTKESKPAWTHTAVNRLLQRAS